jgi:hypothetical protein
LGAGNLTLGFSTLADAVPAEPVAGGASVLGDEASGNAADLAAGDAADLAVAETTAGAPGLGIAAALGALGGVGGTARAASGQSEASKKAGRTNVRCSTKPSLAPNGPVCGTAHELRES